MTDFRPLCEELLSALQRPQRPDPDLIFRARAALSSTPQEGPRPARPFSELTKDFPPERRARIKEQSRQLAKKMAEYKEFDDWFGEVEGFHVREERFWDEVESGDHQALLGWLQQAWSLGHTAGFSKANDIPPLPDNQHLDISWSVATSSALEDQGRSHHIFARLLYSYLTRETPRVSIGEKN